jgi:DNA-directed RNA polymerase subunit RPC12/RpoP
MTIKEKVAYLEGLAEGMAVEADENGKLLLAIIDTLSDIAEEIEELNENALDLGEELDVLSSDLADVEEFLLDYDDFDDDFDFDFDDDDDYDDDDYDEDDEDNDYGCNFCGKNSGNDVEFTIDVNCPECNAEIELDEEDIANESVTCPACNKLIELEIDEVDVENDFDE